MLRECYIGIFVLACYSQQAAFAEFKSKNVANILTIDVPSSWHENNAKHRKNVKNISESIMKDTALESGQHVASLSIVSKKGSDWDGLVRASVMPTELYTQHDFHRDYYLNSEELLAEIHEIFESEFVTLREKLKENNQLVGEISVYYLSVDHFLGFAIAYSRTSTKNPNSRMIVTQVHVPNGSVKALFTFTFRQSEQQRMKPLLEEVLSSIRFL